LNYRQELAEERIQQAQQDAQAVQQSSEDYLAFSMLPLLVIALVRCQSQFILSHPYFYIHVFAGGASSSSDPTFNTATAALLASGEQDQCSSDAAMPVAGSASLLF
jgi:hypothetical protein